MPKSKLVIITSGRAINNEPEESWATSVVILVPMPVNSTTPITIPAVAQAQATITEL